MLHRIGDHGGCMHDVETGTELKYLNADNQPGSGAERPDRDSRDLSLLAVSTYIGEAIPMWAARVG